MFYIKVTFPAAINETRIVGCPSFAQTFDKTPEITD